MRYATLAVGAVLGVLGGRGSAAGPQPVATPAIDANLPDCGIQKTIDVVAAAGGGVVRLPAGRFVLRRYLYLRSGVTLEGRGAATVLRLGGPEHRAAVAGAVASGSRRIAVTGDLRSLRPGDIVHVWRNGPATHQAHLKAMTVAAVDRRAITFTEPYPYKLPAASKAHVSWGKVTRLAADAAKGARSVRVEHARLLRPGEALFFSGKGDMWNHHFNVAAAVNGDTLALDRPLTVNAKKGVPVYLGHCAITADGEKHVGVEDLAVEGWAGPPPPWGGFRLAAIHTVRCSGIAIRSVTVRNWPADGFSIQAGKDLLVTGCTASGCRGHGFHPGTGFTNAEFTKLRSIGNGGDGLYYCWHNVNVNVRDCLLRGNAGHGIGGLGNPGDRKNLIERNTIERNGRAGIAVNGGKVSENVIRRNVIRDNSAEKPGKYPGVWLHAAAEDARAFTVEHNTIASTLDKPTQWVGVREQNGSYRGKPTTADENVIRGNTFRGHKEADVVAVGPKTVVDQPGAKVVRPASPAPR